METNCSRNYVNRRAGKARMEGKIHRLGTSVSSSRAFVCGRDRLIMLLIAFQITRKCNCIDTQLYCVKQTDVLSISLG